MPYAKRSDLPNGVRDNLPPHAKDIYKEAFNSAWDEYGQDEPRAHRVDGVRWSGRTTRTKTGRG